MIDILDQIWLFFLCDVYWLSPTNPLLFYSIFWIILLITNYFVLQDLDQTPLYKNVMVPNNWKSDTRYQNKWIGEYSNTLFFLGILKLRKDLIFSKRNLSSNVSLTFLNILNTFWPKSFLNSIYFHSFLKVSSF